MSRPHSTQIFYIDATIFFTDGVRRSLTLESIILDQLSSISDIHIYVNRVESHHIIQDEMALRSQHNGISNYQDYRIATNSMEDAILSFCIVQEKNLEGCLLALQYLQSKLDNAELTQAEFEYVDAMLTLKQL